MNHAAPVRLVLLTVVLAALGCATTPAKPTLMANTAKDEITVYQLRALDYEYASQFGQLVAACVESITASGIDDATRHHAHQWRLWAAPQARFAAFDQDPVAGVVELWVLAVQQNDFFRDGTGKDWFGPEHECVPRVGSTHGDAMGDPAGQHPRLARARPCDHRHET